MTIIPGQHRPERERDDLLALLALCARQAAVQCKPVLLSISLRVRHIDPLAVLLASLPASQAPDGWHAYFEHSAADTAIAGMDAVWSAAFHGPERFRLARNAARELLADAVHAGDVDAPFVGPRCFCAFTFEDDAAQAAAFAPANVFLPRWQVSRHDGVYTAVANLLVEADAPLEAVADRVLAAHEKFRDFEYGAENPSAENQLNATELGGAWFGPAVSAALEHIATGTLQKVVLARAWRAALPECFSTGPVLEHLRERFPACHTFSFSNGSGSVFIGATPERLAEVSARRLRTEALAGTARRGTYAADDARLGAALLTSDKERREHAAVVDAILAALHGVGVAARAEGAARLALFAGVQHLRTPVVADLPEGVHILDLAAALHPTPAVGGTPRADALALIRELEPSPRGPYSGLLGWFDAQGEGLLLVGIRSAVIGNEDGASASSSTGNKPLTATFRAGAGIVTGTSPERELLETDTKSRVIRDGLPCGVLGTSPISCS